MNSLLLILLGAAFVVLLIALSVGRPQPRGGPPELRREDVRPSRTLPNAREIDPAWRHRIDQAIGAGRELEAIKLYREATGANLQEAHDAILYWERLE